MLKIVDVLGTSWGVGGLIYDYLTGGAWWAWAVDASLLIWGVLSGGTIALIKKAVKVGLKQAIKGLSRKAAITL